MYRWTLILMLAGIGCPICFAQLRPLPRAVQKVNDPSMVIEDRGSKLEVFPAKRAVQQPSSSGVGVIHSVSAADKSAPISPRELGVAFNHSMQVQGYITGEIAFKMKGGLQATDWLDAASYPDLAKLTDPNVYIVVARTPSEFVSLAKRLQSRRDMEWVEPIVLYGAVNPSPDAR